VEIVCAVLAASRVCGPLARRPSTPLWAALEAAPRGAGLAFTRRRRAERRRCPSGTGWEG
jgi:hypothetical protein